MVAPKSLRIPNIVFSLRRMESKQRASALQLFIYSDKDQFYVCVVGVPHLETDKTPLIVLSSPLAQGALCSDKSGHFLEKYPQVR